MQSVAKFYQDKYDEDSRLKTDNARKVEFLTTIYFLDRLILEKSKILDVGAGTGIYSIYYAKKGHEVIACDLTPKYVEVIKAKIEKLDKGLSITAELADAMNLTKHENESFDVVLCFGPLYHLPVLEDRLKVVNESLRVLKKGGILALAYINRFYVFSRLVRDSKKYLNEKWINKIIDEGTISSEDEDCFWTDAYFHTPQEFENMMNAFMVEKLENIGVDGISTLLTQTVNEMNDEEYKNWLKYHFKTCTEPSLLGYSNHGLYICKKK